MSLLRILFIALGFLLGAAALTSCAQTPDIEGPAREELARREIAIDIAGLKEATRRPYADGAYLFEDVGYFSTISDGDFKEALLHAAAARNFGLYVMLDRHGRDVRFPPGDLADSLEEAVRNGSAKLAALLIRYGARPGPDALFHASYVNDYDLAALLLANGADFASSPNDEALRMSARLGNLDALRAFVDSGKAPAQLVDQAITYGALTEQFEVVKYLVEAGVDINHGDSDGCTALHSLAQDGTVEMIRYMVEHGAAVNGTCRGSETPLKWAHYGDNTEVIDFLVGVGGVRE